MGLIAWHPLINNFENKGVASSIPTIVSGNSWESSGKIGAGSLKITKLQTIFPSTSIMSGVKEMSYCYWIKVNTAWSQNWRDGIRWYSTDGSSPYISRQEFYNNCTTIGTWYKSNSTGSISGKSFTPGIWTHLAGTYNYNTGEVKFYIDGICVGTTTDLDTTHYCRGDFYIGEDGVDIDMNDFRIYDHCLSAAEVHEISQGLVLHYKLDGFYGGYGNKNLLAKYVVPGQAGPTSVANGGRTIWLGDYKITIPATENADTYFRLFMTEQLTSGTTYTISCKVSGLLSGSYYKFPLFAQGNTSMGVLNLDHNGLCSLTFTMNWTGTQTAVTGANGETVYVNFLDDSARAIASGQGAITLYDFKLEKGSSATAWCPSDASLTQIQDSSGYGHNGTINDTTLKLVSDTARYSAAIQNSQANNSAAFPFKGQVDMPESSALTFAWWMKPTTWGIQTSGIFSTSAGDSPTDYSTTAANMRDSCFDCCNTNGTCVRINVASYLTLNEWHHYALTYNGSQLNFYKDGVSKVTASQSGSLKAFKNIFPFYSKAGGVNRCTSGSLSDFRIYATALSAADVKSLYEVGAKVDNKGNLHTYEINEHGQNKLKKTGVFYNYATEPYIQLSDGSCWKLMLFHYVDNGNNLFTSSNASYNDGFGLYSRLRDIDNFTYNNKYEFYVIQDGVECRWTQTNAPMTTTSVAGFTAVSGTPGGGICKCSGNTLLAATNSTGNWWRACGCWTKYNGGIPGFGNSVVCKQYLALYARIDKITYKTATGVNYANNLIEF